MPILDDKNKEIEELNRKIMLMQSLLESRLDSNVQNNMTLDQLSAGPLIQNVEATKHITVKQKQSAFNSYLSSQKISPFARGPRFKFESEEEMTKDKVI